MAIGQGYLESAFSYVAFGRETTYGTAVTATAGLDFLSASLKTVRDRKTLEEVTRSRTPSQGISLGKQITAELEFYFRPEIDACGFALQNALGGAVTSATATGETVGAGASSAMTHTFNVGSMDQSYTSLTLTARKGPTTTGKVFTYNGVRVNEMSFSAEIDDALKCTLSMIGKDSTVGATDVAGFLTVSAASPLVFDAGRLSVETSFASITTTSYWHVQSVEFGWSNALLSDNDARRIGSNVIDVLPPGMMEINLKAKIRFDTTTAFDAMVNATQLACQLEFLGATLTGSAIRKGLKFNFPKVFIKDAGDPEIGGPDGILTSEVTFQVLQDDSSAGGYAIQALLTNQKTSYA